MVAHTEVTDEAVAPTCTETGLTEGKHCSVCNTVLVAQKTVKANGHSFGEWKTVKEATCTENGEQERTCSCNEKEQQEIPSTGHTEGEWIVDKEATAKDDGEKHQICSVCKETLKNETLPATGSLGLAYTVNDGTTCTITGIGTCTDTELVIPKSINGYPVREIGRYAFAGCSNLETIAIPETVEFIDKEAFYNCKNIKSVYISDISMWIKSPFPCVYSNPLCYGANLYLNEKILTHVVIPDGTTHIYSYTFYGFEGLLSITIPESVECFEYEVFAGCSNLTTIYYTGTKAQWNAIYKYSTWDTETGNYTVYCTDGEITKN
jgi:hypothetical protein